jgi:hypothetical protein
MISMVFTSLGSDIQLPVVLQYPVSEHGFEFQQLLVETLYGVSVWDRLRSLVNLLKMISEQNARPAPVTTKKRTENRIFVGCSAKCQLFCSCRL